MTYKSVGIIGAGIIGNAVFDYLKGLSDLHVEYVLVADKKEVTSRPELAKIAIDDMAQTLARRVDLVIEAATPSVVRAVASQILAQSDFCAFSCSALAEAQVENEIWSASERSGRRFILPHGAILGLDGLVDGRAFIESVTVTTIKNGESLGQDAQSEGVVFEGTTRQACAAFPRNVNVHAAIALAGLGFDQTRSIVIADPNTSCMKHNISVRGPGLEWEISVSSTSLGGVSGSYTPQSAVGSIRRLLGNPPIFNV
ncbi:DUF108 domain-containing protein [Agrobacterium tumefaciens]|uniref:aspartate dehydrogenase domain-containing protein n=1 Tax=Agrobacterium tumefaciens TaxID=358 RepID=UPI0015737ED6|nr:aspartate dehydrogenase domain-containing protein [Agrobacterium tumefaciens]NSY99644.1 DUF108 domain-containing protein [Agrobacterium tumefaciens]NSZ36397.1 DUF108 domain-containing protein [Agrobacterium tumefaciens]NTB21913.1 DUF108 domain-containing protein [Agrobacterium tumefaciens]NTB31741.1 DUF108 domain-containing protein [Agrobacterium tumefaciens]NTB32222.1 DUF108 domain-containing protein [Agrobacterium tumefaciens]